MAKGTELKGTEAEGAKKDLFKYKKPSTSEVAGELVNFDTLPNDKGILITFVPAEGHKTLKVITSENQLKKFSSNGKSYLESFQPSSRVVIEIEHHEENVTGYIDNATGEEKAHPFTGFALRTIRNISSFEMQDILTTSKINAERKARRDNMKEDLVAYKDALKATELFGEEADMREAISRSVAL